MYFVDYESSTGKILSFLDEETQGQKQGALKEVTRLQFLNAQKFNKIVIDGSNISFEKVTVVLTQDELKEQFKQNRATIMNSIGWMHERKQSQDRLIFATLMTPEDAAWNATQGDEYYLYKQSLRDRPSIITDWTSISYPVVPQHVYDAMEKEIKALCQELQCDPVV